MLKLVIITATGLIALAGVYAAGFPRSSNPDREQVSGGTMPSIEELHSKPHVKDLPVQEVKEHF
jgi:hypothetical protein